MEHCKKIIILTDFQKITEVFYSFERPDNIITFFPSFKTSTMLLYRKYAHR